MWKARHCSHCFQCLLSQLGCWLFFALFSAVSAFNKSAAHQLFHSIEIFEQRHEFFTLSYSAGRTRL
ncbi:hypothetical protein EI540_04305 [Serratia marcescens subsp. marcescens ATCC 13880]|nr:hypothetical protein EI540_04305 [Serratia marcescens subsp. marcescens ATCC 13880]